MAGILERYYLPPTGKFAIILPWQLIFSNFSPAKTGGNGSLFIPVNQLACQTRLVETWKALHLENYCLNDVFERVENGTIRTRSSNKIKLKSHFKTRIREASFQLPSVHLWNSAPTEITEATSESRARAEIRKYVMQNIPI